MTNGVTGFVIEFRSGSFFQNLEAALGGPRRTAWRFASEQKAEDFMDQHEWIIVNGGMVVPAAARCDERSAAVDQALADIEGLTWWTSALPTDECRARARSILVALYAKAVRTGGT